jgi:hypothetical protein
MNRARFAIAATFAGASLIGVSLLAQSAPQAPKLTSVLAGKKITPPLKGEAQLEFAQPVTKRVKDTVVTTIKVKNTSSAPIARLTIDETWFDKGGELVTGSKGSLQKLLQPGEIDTVTIETPYSPKMTANSWRFSHANGAVKPTKVKSFDEPKEPATKTAAATKPAKKKK